MPSVSSPARTDERPSSQAESTTCAGTGSTAAMSWPTTGRRSARGRRTAGCRRCACRARRRQQVDARGQRGDGRGGSLAERAVDSSGRGQAFTARPPPRRRGRPRAGDQPDGATLSSGRRVSATTSPTRQRQRTAGEGGEHRPRHRAERRRGHQQHRAVGARDRAEQERAQLGAPDAQRAADDRAQAGGSRVEAASRSRRPAQHAATVGVRTEPVHGRGTGGGDSACSRSSTTRWLTSVASSPSSRACRSSSASGSVTMPGPADRAPGRGPAARARPSGAGRRDGAAAASARSARSSSSAVAAALSAAGAPAGPATRTPGPARSSRRRPGRPSATAACSARTASARPCAATRSAGRGSRTTTATRTARPARARRCPAASARRPRAVAISARTPGRAAGRDRGRVVVRNEAADEVAGPLVRRALSSARLTCSCMVRASSRCAVPRQGWSRSAGALGGTTVASLLPAVDESGRGGRLRRPGSADHRLAAAG